MENAISGGTGGGSVLTVEVLGPLVVSVDGRPMELSSSTLRTLLVVLAMDAGSPVPMERLAASLWKDELPASPRRALHTHLSRLRGAVGRETVVREMQGY